MVYNVLYAVITLHTSDFINAPATVAGFQYFPPMCGVFLIVRGF